MKDRAVIKRTYKIVPNRFVIQKIRAYETYGKYYRDCAYITSLHFTVSTSFAFEMALRYVLCIDE